MKSEGNTESMLTKFKWLYLGETLIYNYEIPCPEDAFRKMKLRYVEFPYDEDQPAAVFLSESLNEDRSLISLRLMPRFEKNGEFVGSVRARLRIQGTQNSTTLKLEISPGAGLRIAAYVFTLLLGVIITPLLLNFLQGKVQWLAVVLLVLCLIPIYLHLLFSPARTFRSIFERHFSGWHETPRRTDRNTYMKHPY